MDVALVNWPKERRRRDELAGTGLPRLLLVQAGTPPPVSPDCLEEWVVLPCSDAEVAARVQTLKARAGLHAGDRPTVDEHGIVRRGSSWVTLPPLEARLMAELVDRTGAVVPRDVMLRAAWPDGQSRRNVLDVHMVKLRRRVRPLGLSITTVRGRGYLLEAGALQPGPSKP